MTRLADWIAALLRVILRDPWSRALTAVTLAVLACTGIAIVSLIAGDPTRTVIAMLVAFALLSAYTHVMHDSSLYGAKEALRALCDAADGTLDEVILIDQRLIGVERQLGRPPRGGPRPDPRTRPMSADEKQRADELSIARARQAAARKQHETEETARRAETAGAVPMPDDFDPLAPHRDAPDMHIESKRPPPPDGQVYAYSDGEETVPF